MALYVARAQQPGIRRTDLQRHDLSAPGREVVQVRVDFDPGLAFGKHHHPGEEIVHVLEGSLEYEVEGKTSPVAVEDVARVLATLLANPQPHIGKIYHLTGPQSENMHFYAQEYSKALGRTITYEDIPVEPWRDGLLERGLPIHLVNHLATMADLHRVGRYARMSDDVRTLTGQGPLSVQDFVRKNAATFTASTKEA